jgi:hypothetical protein
MTMALIGVHDIVMTLGEEFILILIIFTKACVEEFSSPPPPHQSILSHQKQTTGGTHNPLSGGGNPTKRAAASRQRLGIPFGSEDAAKWQAAWFFLLPVELRELRSSFALLSVLPFLIEENPFRLVASFWIGEKLLCSSPTWLVCFLPPSGIETNGEFFFWKKFFFWRAKK